MNETLCKFCGGAEPLIKAHIIPAGLYARPEKSKEALKIISTDNPGRTRKSWTGIYDDELVCRACEDMWDSWDAYGIDFLRNIEKYAKPILSEGRLLGYQSDDYDYSQLKLFFLSVAWRCGASGRKEFCLVKLGPYQDKLKKVIENRNPNEPSGFDVSFTRFDDTNLGTALLNPHCERFDGINYLSIYMYGFIVSVKMDRRPGASIFRPLTMHSGEPLRIALRNFKNSPEHRLMFKMARDVPR
ncbi:hypothetical protein [Thalassospira xiamenensis]|uniref:hypothetical protein n=1 Tax=Thalassospira xiamenensis TaxID=220697 RepID=UPI0007A634DB|nr:hypothetical protein [Thalassospira xiamenensis]KZD04136.1 hypothetical protein AUP45_21685 [Thalassospira xiamenensis]